MLDELNYHPLPTEHQPIHKDVVELLKWLEELRSYLQFKIRHNREIKRNNPSIPPKLGLNSEQVAKKRR